MADVRAGDVEFDRRDATDAVESAGQVDELAGVRPGDAHDHGSPRCDQPGQEFDQERIDAVVVEADRVEQSGRRLDCPPGLVALTRQRRDRLRHDAAETADGDVVDHLPAIAERARGHHDRIREPQPAERHGEVRRRLGGEGGAMLHGLEMLASRVQARV